jgi:hypothetical protein
MGQSVQLTLRGDETKPYTDRQCLRTFYDDEGHTASEIAAQFECDVMTVRKYLQAFGLSDADDCSLPAVSLYTGKQGYEHLYVDERHLRLHRVLIIAEYGLDARRATATCITVRGFRGITGSTHSGCSRISALTAAIMLVPRWQMIKRWMPISHQSRVTTCGSDKQPCSRSWTPTVQRATPSAALSRLWYSVYH